MKTIKFIFNVIKSIWWHRDFINEMRSWEFNGVGELESITTDWFNLKKGE